MSIKPFIVQLSNKQEVSITSDELDSITMGVKTGSMIKLRRAIINPSFIVSIIPDTEKWRTFLYEGLCGFNGEDYIKKKKELIESGMKPYNDVFNSFKDQKQLK